MERREFILALGGAAASWPFAARAQQPAMPVVGYLNAGPPTPTGFLIAAFRQGLSGTGFDEGRNVAIEYRWADGHYDRLPALAAELVRSRVAVIVATGSPAAGLAAKTATTSIPVVFSSGSNPVKMGLVNSLRRPDGNLTGVNLYSAELVTKQLDLLHEMLPQAGNVAVLVNPAAPTSSRRPKMRARRRTPTVNNSRSCRPLHSATSMPPLPRLPKNRRRADRHRPIVR